MNANAKLLLVLNPCAGQRRANRVMTEILQILSRAGYRTEVFVTTARRDATRYCAAHAAEFDRIVCVGGDGTLNETIAGVLQAGTDTVIGYIPAGTTNDYASSLGLSSDILQAAQDAVDGEIFPMDVGTFNGRSFTYTASCGAFTRASYATPQTMKNALGHLAYVINGIGDLSSMKPIPMRIQTGEQVYEGEYLFLSVTNSTSVGGILKLDPSRVDLHDGLFEVMLIRNPENPIQFSNILFDLAGKNLPSEMIQFFSASRIEIEVNPEVEWTLDGEHEQGHARVELVNHHNAIRISVPRTERQLPEGEQA